MHRILAVFAVISALEAAVLPECGGSTPATFDLRSSGAGAIKEITDSDDSNKSQAQCPANQVGFGGSCTGDNCDNFTWHCSGVQDTSYRVYGYDESEISLWFGHTTDGMDPFFCPENQVTVSVMCAGDDCDDMSFRCAPIKLLSTESAWTQPPTVTFASNVEDGCQWMERLSDETSAITCPSNMFLRGLRCEEDNCDDLFLYCCPGKANACEKPADIVTEASVPESTTLPPAPESTSVPPAPASTTPSGGYSSAAPAPTDGGYSDPAPINDGGYSSAAPAPTNGDYSSAAPAPTSGGYSSADPAPINDGGYSSADPAPINDGGYSSAAPSPTNGDGYPSAEPAPTDNGYNPPPPAPSTGGYKKCHKK